MAHNNKDSNHLQQLSPGMQVNTRYINSTKNTSWFFFKKKPSFTCDYGDLCLEPLVKNFEGVICSEVTLWKELTQ